MSVHTSVLRIQTQVAHVYQARDRWPTSKDMLSKHGVLGSFDLSSMTRYVYFNYENSPYGLEEPEQEFTK